MDFGSSVGKFINLPNEISLSGEFAISFWLKPTANNINLLGNSNNTNYVYINPSNQVGISSSDIAQTFSSTIISSTSGNWQNLLITRDSSNVFRTYVNGDIANTVTDAGTFSFNQIGRYYNVSTNDYRGEMSNVAIWNSDQSSNKDNIYNNGSPQTSYTVSPQNWWKLNADSVYTPSAPNYTTALDFTGTQHIKSVGTRSFNNFSISFWFNTATSPSAFEGYVSGQTGTGNDYSLGGFSIFYYNGGLTLQSSNVNFNLPFTNNITLGNWNHIVVDIDNSNSSTGGKLYLNGQLALETTNSGAYTYNFNNLWIGSRSTSGGNATNLLSDSKVSNVSVFNSNLTASQVSTLFNFGTPETITSFSPYNHYKLNNNTTGVQDSGSAGNNAVITGTLNSVNTSVAVVPSWKIPNALPITTTPNFTTALDFDGNDYIDCGSSSNLELQTISVSFWIKETQSASSLVGVVAKNSSSNYGWIVWVDANKLIWQVGDGGASSDSFTYSKVPNFRSYAYLNQWNNICCTFDGTDAKIYINNVLHNVWTPSSPFSIDYTNVGNLNIGKRADSTSPKLNASLSNVSIFNSTLTASQVSTLYNGGTPETAISFSPVSWWKLDTGGSTITDYGSGGNNGTNNGTATQVTSDVLATQPVNGVSTTLPSTALQQSDLQFDSPYSNYSLNFDGTGDYIDCTDISYFSGADRFTLSTWFKVTDNPSTNTNRDIISKGSTTSGTTSFFIRKGKNTNLNKISVSFDEGSTNVFSTTQIQNDVWYHVVAVYKGYESNNTDRAKIYINGVDDTASYTNTVPTTLVSSTQPLRIGRWASGTDFFGKIDETAIWQSALTDAQILQVYNNGRPSDITSLSPNYWWRLGENAYFNDVPAFTVPNSISGAPNGTGSGTINTMISADAPGTYANGIGTNLDILDRVGDAALSTSNSQSYNMIPSDISPYVPQYVGDQIANNFSMTFDGSSYVDTGTSLGNALGSSVADMTVSLWYKNTIAANQGLFSIISSNSAGTTAPFSIQGSNGTSIYVYVGSSYKQYTVTHDTNWHHLSIVKNGTSLTTYIDGNSVTPTATSGSVPAIIDTTNKITFIGLYFSTAYTYNGQIDEVAIFDTALNAGQIYNDIYQPTATAPGNNQTADLDTNPNLPTPVAWYRMGD
jgi:hypothetical protein